MPHQNLPESWIDRILYGFGVAVAAITGWFLRRFWLLEDRVGTLERLAAQDILQREEATKTAEDVAGRLRALEVVMAKVDERHTANIIRLERIERGNERMELKLDRLADRGEP